MNQIKLGRKGITLIPDELDSYQQKDQIVFIEILNNKIVRFESFSSFTALKVLELSNCSLSQLFLNPNFKLKGLMNLVALGFQNNQIETLYQDVFDGCTNLTTLDMSDNHLNDRIRGLRKLQFLQNLDLSKNKIDCIANLIVMKGYLRNINLLIIMDNPLEKNIAEKSQLNILKEWFPSLKQLECKFSTIKYSNQTDELFSNKSNTKSNDSTELEKNQSNIRYETPKKLQRVGKVVPHTQQEIQFNTNEISEEYLLDLRVSPARYLLTNEQSIIHEEEVEQSFLSYRKEVIDLVETINQPKQNSEQKTSTITSSMKKSRNLSQDGGGSTSPSKKYQKFLQNGTINEEILNLEKIITQKQNELTRVDNELQNEQKQNRILKQIIDFFVDFMKISISLEFGSDNMLFQEIFYKMLSFCSSFDKFDEDQIKSINKSIIMTQIQNKQLNADEKIAGLQLLLEDCQEENKF